MPGGRRSKLLSSLAAGLLLSACAIRPSPSTAGRTAPDDTPDSSAIVEMLAKIGPEERKAIAKEAFLQALWLDLQGQDLMSLDLLEEAAWADPNDRWLQFTLAAKLREFRRSAEALSLVRRALTLPGEETPEQWGLAAGLWMEAGQKDSSTACWKRMLELAPDSREALIGVASLAEGRGDLVSAAKAYSTLATQYAAQGRALSQRSVSLWIRAGFFDSAVAELQRRWSTWGQPEEGAMLARLLGSQGSPEKAALLFDSLATRPELDAFALRLDAARAFLNSGRIDSARRRMRSLALQGHAESRIELGALLLDIDSVASAKSLLFPMADDPAHGGRACQLLGLEAARRGKTDSARLWLDRSLRKDPKKLETWVRRGLVELDDRRPDSAAAIFQRVVALWPASPQMRWLLGHSLAKEAEMRSRRPSWLPPAPDSEPMPTSLRLHALAALDTALALDSTHARARFERAALLERLGRRDQSIEGLRSIVAEDTTNIVAANYLAYMLAEDSSDLEHALSLADRALSVDSANPSFLDTRGWILFRMQRLEEALTEVDRSIAAGEDDPVVFEHRARILQSMGRPEESLQAWKELLRRAPTHEEARRRVQGNP